MWVWCELVQSGDQPLLSAGLVGQGLVSAQDAERFERSFRNRVRDATVDALAREPELLTVMYTTKKDASADEPELGISPDPKMTRSMLETAMQRIRNSGAVESRPGHVRSGSCSSRTFSSSGPEHERLLRLS